MMQKLYRLWVVLMLISVGVSLVFFARALAGVWQFLSLSEQTPARHVELEVQEVSSSRFAIAARYVYDVGGVTYKGKTVFENPLFLHRMAAENYQVWMKHKPRTVCYMQRNPALSSLEHPFPYKRCLQSLVTMGVFLYFYFARGLLLRQPL